MDRPLVYLNNAATSWPKPDCVTEIVQRVLAMPCHETGRSSMCDFIDYPSEARNGISRLLGTADPDHVVFTQNATDSLNILIHGFVKQHPGQFHVITTDLEHNSVLRPLATLRQEGRISLTVLKSDKDFHITPELIDPEVRSDTRLVVMNHGSNVVGSVQDIRDIGSLLHEKGIFFIVDGAQTLGQTTIDISDGSVDAFAFTGHKYLFGMQGTGGFYLNEPHEVASTKQGGTGADSRNLFHPEDMPLKYEAGTANYPGIASLHAGITYVEAAGIDRIEAHTMDLCRYLTRSIRQEPGVTIDNEKPELPVISFNIRNLDNEDAGLILARAYNIITRTGLHCAPLIHERLNEGTGSIRLSLSLQNTREQCDIALNALHEVIPGADN
ncbi:MAG TPA: aminotransferase class V-fold PLP-dependent enzyme [Methanoregulaceae archaeon]|nr:aminotransferase class V-fold PLP-dependent enzyme [Methanoregulaceae archaeon]